MFYTIYWPIPVEVLVRLKYPMILALQDADCVTNSCPASAYITLLCSLGNYTFIDMVINPRMKRF